MSIPFVSEKSKNLIVTKQQYTARQQKDKRKNNHSKNRDQRFQFPTAFSNTHTLRLMQNEADFLEKKSDV